MKRPLIGIVLGLALVLPMLADDIEVGTRHVRHYVRPTMPEIAKKMNLKGAVKLESTSHPVEK